MKDDPKANRKPLRQNDDQKSRSDPFDPGQIDPGRFDPDRYHRYVGRYQKDKDRKNRPRKVLTGEERAYFDQLTGAKKEFLHSKKEEMGAVEEDPIWEEEKIREEARIQEEERIRNAHRIREEYRIREEIRIQEEERIRLENRIREEERKRLEKQIQEESQVQKEDSFREESEEGEEESRHSPRKEESLEKGAFKSWPLGKNPFRHRPRPAYEEEDDDLEEEEEEEEAPRRTPIKTKIKRFFTVILALLLTFLVINLSICYSWDKEKKNLPVPAADEGNRLRRFGLDMMFLLAGVDDTGEGTPQRSDTLMLVRLNFWKGKTTVLSIPRDTYVQVRGKPTKVNHAYAYGGPELTVETIRDFLGIDLDYYMVVDYETVKAVIDAMGGVSYTIPEKAAPVEGERYRTGDHVLKGEEALFYLRHRQGYPRGDIDRVEAQQAFLKEAAIQALSPGKALRWPAMLSAFAAHAKTNIPSIPMIPRAPRLMNMVSDPEIIQLPGRPAYLGGISYYMVNEAEARNLVQEYFEPFMIEEESAH